jgi:hypothetical protein
MYNMDEPWKRAEWKMSDTQDHVLYDSTKVNHLELGKFYHRDRK